MISKENFINQYPMLNEPGLIDEIISVSNEITMPFDEILIDLGQQINSFPLILSGSMKILRENEDGNEVFLYYVDAGNTCAATLSCCIEGMQSNIRAIVEEEATFLNIPIEYMDIWLEKYKSWRNYIFQSFSSRFNDLLHAVDQLAFKKMDDRILNYLNETSSITDSKLILISHQKIAIDLNTSREVVSRILKQMENDGFLSIGRGKIELH